MNPEPARTKCEAYRDELLRLACGDFETSDVSAALGSHLAGCPACVQTLEELGDLAHSLRRALPPDPLPARLVHAVQRDLAERVVRPARRGGRRLLSLLGTAAAAALLPAAFVPRGGTPAVSPLGWSGPVSGLVRSSEDAAEIVRAMGLLEWSDPWEASLSEVNATLSSLDRAVSREAGGEGVLPWGPEDDWDAPLPAGKPPAPPTQPSPGARSGARVGPAAAAVAGRSRSDTDESIT